MDIYFIMVSVVDPKLYRIPINELTSQIVYHIFLLTFLLLQLCFLFRQLFFLLSKITAEHGKAQ